jgi:hypothetical protein
VANSWLQEAISFQLQAESHVARQQGNQFRQSWNALSFELWATIGCAQHFQLSQRHAGYRPGAIRRSIHRLIVDADKDIIGGQVQVGFNDVCALGQRLSEGRKCILRAGYPVAPMGHEVRFGLAWKDEGRLVNTHRSLSPILD